MLKPPRLGGAAQLRLMVDELGFAWACKVVQVHPTTMRRWLREETPVPQAVLQALYWLTSWGFGEACSEAHWSHQMLVDKVHRLDCRVPVRFIARDAVNEPRYHAPGLVVPLDRA